MWWLAIPAVGLIGKLVIDVLAEPTKASPRIRTTLEKNLSRLRATLREAGSHRIAILGQPGAGKSSLLKKMTGGKVTPAPVIGVETDATVIPPANGGVANVHGIEVDARVPLKASVAGGTAVELRANLSRNWSRVEGLVGPDSRLGNQAPLTANLGLDLRMP
jgi:hypothetical protein